MRTMIDLPQRDLSDMAELAKERGVDPLELVRQAVKDYLRFHQKAPDAAFGLWKDGSKDGLRLQQAARTEWSQ